MSLEITWFDALRIFIDEAEQVGIRSSGPHRGPFSGENPVHETLVEALGICWICIPVSVSRPPDLSNDYGHVRIPILG